MAISPEYLAILAVVMLAVGAITGLIAGLLGVGGGIVIVPVLYYVLTTLGVPEDVTMHVAVGTSLATIIATSAKSIGAHRKRGAVDDALLKSWGPAIFVGVIIGTAIAGYVKGPELSAVFATIATIVALHMAFGKESWRIANQLPTGAGKHALAGFIGAVSAMMGIGGGTLSVPILSLYGYPIIKAVGTAAAIGFIIGIPGAIGFVITGWGEPGLPPYSLGYINLPAALLILPTSMWLAPVGARLAHTIDRTWLRRAFALFLAITAVRMFYGLLT